MTEVSSPPEYARTIFILVAERNIDVARGLHQLAVRRDEAQAVHGVGDRHMAHLIILIAHHRAEFFFANQLHGFDAEARPENPVERRWCAAALEMAEDRATRFLSRARRDLARNDKADTAVTIFAFIAMTHHDLAVTRLRTFCYDDNRREVPTVCPGLNGGRDLLVIE